MESGKWKDTLALFENTAVSLLHPPYSWPWPLIRGCGHWTLDIGHWTLFRPPYGKATLWQRVALKKKGYRLIYWDILTRDYDATQKPEQMFSLIKRDTRPGSIINFHDSLKSNERMLAVLPQAIEWLQAQGYTLRAL